MITIDGIVWDVPCTIEREAEIKSSDISGLMLDKSYFNDVLGTYLRYSIKLAVPRGRMNNYYLIHAALTAPVNEHQFVLPYNDSTVTLTARVSNVSDVYVRLPNGGVAWRGIKFDVISNYPMQTSG